MIKDMVGSSVNIDYLKKVNRKMVSDRSLYLGSSFSNMVFQNESFKSITNLDLPHLLMPKSPTCSTFFLRSIEPTPNALET